VKQAEEFVATLPKTIVDTKGQTFDFGDKLLDVLKFGAVKGNYIPPVPNFNLKGRWTKVIGGSVIATALGLPYIQSVIMNFKQGGNESRKEISYNIDKLISKLCPITLNPTDETQKIAQEIFDAGLMDQSTYQNMLPPSYGTKKLEIQSQINNIKSVDDFCRVAAYFNNYYDRPEYKKLDNKIKHYLAKFLDYEFTGIISDPVGAYQTYVYIPLKSRLDNFFKTMQKKEEKSEGKAEPPKTYEDTKVETTVKNENQIFYDTKLFTKNLPCVVTKCNKFPCKLDPSGWLMSGDGLYYYYANDSNFKNFGIYEKKDEKNKYFIAKCSGNEIQHTNEPHITN
jgi:hypothetical protein